MRLLGTHMTSCLWKSGQSSVNVSYSPPSPQTFSWHFWLWKAYKKRLRYDMLYQFQTQRRVICKQMHSALDRVNVGHVCYLHVNSTDSVSMHFITNQTVFCFQSFRPDLNSHTTATGNEIKKQKDGPENCIQNQAVETHNLSCRKEVHQRHLPACWGLPAPQPESCQGA